MNAPGASDLLALTRSALLTALEALDEHRHAVVLIGAQAVFLQTTAAELALPETTKDSDLALDPRGLADSPLIEEAMRSAGFELDRSTGQPGSWLSPEGVPVDLMVPEALAGRGGRRGARVPPHSTRAMRRAVGLEAAVVDNRRIRVGALTTGDQRAFDIKVASPAALVVSKLHKLSERENAPDRLVDKDAHDVFRLLAAAPVDDLVVSFEKLLADSLSAAVTRQALESLRRLFADGPNAPGSVMAGRAEAGIGTPEVAAASVAILAADVLNRLE